jgi:hypothetical protein
MEVTKQMYDDAMKIVEVYENQLQHDKCVSFIPSISDDMILEYQCIGDGEWYEYTEDLQKSMYFEPIRTRVRLNVES